VWPNERAAVAHAVSRHLETFYRRDRVTIEPPKGSYACVAVCGMTDTLLGPPNYHDYQDRLRKLHAERFSSMPFEAYKSRVRVWMAGVATIGLALLIMLIPTLAFLLFPGPIVSLYIQDQKVIAIATTLVFLAAFFELADAAQASSISLLRSLNDVVQPSVISLVAFWVIGLPFGYWLAVHQGWNAKGIWMGYLVALIIQAILFLRRFFRLVKNMKGPSDPIV